MCWPTAQTVPPAAATPESWFVPEELPFGVEAPVVTVIVLGPEPVTVAGRKPAPAPEGRPAALNATPDRFQLGFGLGLINPLEPVPWPF